MKLVVGLGNPGREYEHTRHNIGFDFLDYFVSINEISGNWCNKFNGIFLQTNINNEKIMFLKPQSFMNLSGEVVKKYVDYFKIDISDILIISDDLDISIGNFKLKASGSSGGHNGLKNIELHLGTQNYKRLKIGISKSGSIDTKDYVLGKLSTDEKNKINACFKELNIVLNDYFYKDFNILMSLYNKKNR